MLLRQVFFFSGGRGRLAPKKGVTLDLQATDIREKRAVYFGGEERGRFAQKKGVTLHPRATAGFTIFLSFVALVHKKLYVDHYLSCRRFGDEPPRPC